MEGMEQMTDRPILRLPNAKPARRLRGAPANMPQPRAGGRQGQDARFREEFRHIEQALAAEDSDVVFRQNPAGITPERALVFVTAVPIANFIRVAQDIGLEVFSEIDVDDYELPGDLIDEGVDLARPTLYATMPSEDVLNRLLRLWRSFQRNEKAAQGDAPWWNLFDMLAELRPWGPEDRLTNKTLEELSNRLPFDDDEEVRLELEIWPTVNREKRSIWKNDTVEKVNALGGRVIADSSINENGFVYEALLIAMRAGDVRDMIDNPYAPEGLATLDGLQFVLPQTIAQSLPSDSEPIEIEGDQELQEFDEEAPFRVVLLDGTPVAGHRVLDGGVVIEDVHDLVSLSLVEHRRHATSMASLILRGDLVSDGKNVSDSRLLSIPVLVDTEYGASSPLDSLFVDIVHIALQRAFAAEEPLAPEAFVVNFSIGIRGAHFSGMISALARLMDWWADNYGILFIVSSGNVSTDLHIPDTNSVVFEAADIENREALVDAAKRLVRHERTLFAPSEAINIVTVGAASIDLSEPLGAAIAGEIAIHKEGEIHPALSSAIGLGPFKSIKPDLLCAGGKHNIRLIPDGTGINLRVIDRSPNTGLNVASTGAQATAVARSRGTSCANALTTRAHLYAAAALTDADGPYNGLELPTRDLSLLTRALAINSARWPETAKTKYQRECAPNPYKHLQAKEEVTRYYGHGLIDELHMCEAPALGSSLVGLGTVRKDGAIIFEMPLPSSLSGQRIGRSLHVTLAWFSPVDPARAKYRLASLEAIAADGSPIADENEDKGWNLNLKSGHLDVKMNKRGTVWSRRLITNQVHAPEYGEEQILPIRVQCRDASGGGLSQDDDIRFAIAVTLEIETETELDIHEEIKDKLRIRLQGDE